MKRPLFSKLKTIGSLTFFFFVYGCSSEAEIVVLNRQMNTVVQEADSLSMNASLEEWSVLEAEYDALYSEYDQIKETLTEEERTEMNKSIGKFEALKEKRTMETIKDDVKDLGDQVESFFEEISK